MSETRQSYLSEIERFFSALRLGGFFLSPRDMDRAQEWFDRGIPLGVVLRGITEGVGAWRAHATPGQRPPHRLGFYQKRIRTHIKVYQREEETAYLELSRPRRFVKARLAELTLLLEAEDRDLEREVKAGLLTRLQDLDVRMAAEEMPEGATAYELLLLDEETLQLYHHRLTGRAGPPEVADEDGLRERLRTPTLRYWST